MDATYEEFENAPAVAGSAADSQDLTDEVVSNSPELTIAGNIQYRRPLPGDSWMMMARAGYQYQTEYFTTLANDEYAKNDDTFTLDLSVQLVNEDLGFGVQAFGRNVTNELIISQGALAPLSVSPPFLGQQGNDGVYALRINEPATWGFSVFYEF